MSTHNQALQFYKAPGNNASGVAQPFIYCNPSQCSRDRNRCPGQQMILDPKRLIMANVKPSLAKLATEKI